MNPYTGSVGEYDEWLSAMPNWNSGTDGLTPQQQFDLLVEVVQDETGEWVEVE